MDITGHGLATGPTGVVTPGLITGDAGRIATMRAEGLLTRYPVALTAVASLPGGLSH
jgi:hypothetical protein